MDLQASRMVHSFRFTFDWQRSILQSPPAHATCLISNWPRQSSRTSIPMKGTNGSFSSRAKLVSPLSYFMWTANSTRNMVSPSSQENWGSTITGSYGGCRGSGTPRELTPFAPKQSPTIVASTTKRGGSNPLTRGGVTPVLWTIFDKTVGVSIFHIE